MGVAERAQPGFSAEAAQGDRWVGVGQSGDPDARTAGEAAAQAALGGREAKLLVVFCSDAYDLDQLLAGISEASGGAPLIGCSTAGEIAPSGVSDGGVVVTGLGGEGFAVKTVGAQGAASRLRDVGREAASCMSELDGGPHRVLMLLTDGVAGDQKEIIRGVHDVVGSAIPLVGGCAGDGMKMDRTFQIHGSEFFSDGVAAAAIASDAPIGIGWSHGWERVGEPMLITSSASNRVFEIDDRPALDAYLERLDAPNEVRLDPAAFTRWARTHPLGLGRRRNGQEPVRCVGEADFETRSLACTAEVPQGGLAWLMRGDTDSVLRSTETACREALGSLDGREPIGVITFDCIGRRGVLGDEGIQTEVERIRGTADGVPVAGFYTYGEIARTRGVNAVHSQTLVALALS